jgi:hypothetical protein
VHLLHADYHWPTMLHIYQRLEKTGGLRSLFWDRDPGNPMPLPEFLTSYNPTSGTLMFLIEHVPIGEQPVFAGIFTLASFLKTHRALIGIWLEPKYRGVNSHWILKQVISHCHKTLKLDNLYGITPWPHAQALALRSGMVEVAELPNYCRVGDRVMDARVFHSDQHLWRYQVRGELEAYGYSPETAEKLMRDFVGDTKLDLGMLMTLRAESRKSTRSTPTLAGDSNDGIE